MIEKILEKPSPFISLQHTADTLLKSISVVVRAARQNARAGEGTHLPPSLNCLEWIQNLHRTVSSFFSGRH